MQTKLGALGVTTMLAFVLFLGFDPAAATVAKGSCTAYDDDWGMGGSSVSCDLPCQRHEALAVLGHAQDPDAGVSASYNCADQGAACTDATPACADISKGLTNSKGDEGECKAESNEFWSSTIMVACARLGGLPGDDADAIDVVCRALDLDIEPCDGTTDIADVFHACSSFAPVLGGLEPDVLLGLFPPALLGEDIRSYLAAAAFPDGGLITVAFEKDTLTGPTCDVQFRPSQE